MTAIINIILVITTIGTGLLFGIVGLLGLFGAFDSEGQKRDAQIRREVAREKAQKRRDASRRTKTTERVE